MDPFGAIDLESDIMAQLLATNNGECGQDQALGGTVWPNYYNVSDNESNSGVCMLHLAQWCSSSTSNISSCATGFDSAYNSESQESFYLISDPNYQVLQNTDIDVDLIEKRKYRREEDDNPFDQMGNSKAILSTKKKAKSYFQIENINENIKSHMSTVITRGDEEESNCVLRQMNSGCYSSEEASQTSQGYNGGPKLALKDTLAVNLNGKKRASGSATDPQSLYARKRRERINQRLKILQHLVPNGTKVDISTMLEEAVQYVKFLQLQIKLLSSDDLWMYAPIVYNAMNIGLDLKKLP